MGRHEAMGKDTDKDGDRRKRGIEKEDIGDGDDDDRENAVRDIPLSD